MFLYGWTPQYSALNTMKVSLWIFSVCVCVCALLFFFPPPSILEEEKMFSDPQVDRKLTQVTGKLIASETVTSTCWGDFRIYFVSFA